MNIKKRLTRFTSKETGASTLLRHIGISVLVIGALLITGQLSGLLADNSTTVAAVSESRMNTTAGYVVSLLGLLFFGISFIFRARK